MTMYAVQFCLISVLIPDGVSAPANVIRLVRQVEDDDYGLGTNGSSIEDDESEAYEETDGEDYEEDYDEHDDVPESKDGGEVEDEIENEVGGKVGIIRKP